MATSDCINTLINTQWVNEEVNDGKDTQAADWKRVTERNGPDGNSVIRVFEHIDSKKKFYFVTAIHESPEAGLIVPAGQWFYAAKTESGKTVLHLNAKSYWDEHHDVWDQNVSDFMCKVFGISFKESGGSEISSNKIVFESGDISEVIAKLEKAGFKRYAQFEEYMAA